MKTGLEVKVVASEKGRKKNDVKKIKIEMEGNKEKKIPVRCETIPQEKAVSAWGWHEEFRVEWSETLISKKRKKRHGG